MLNKKYLILLFIFGFLLASCNSNNVSKRYIDANISPHEISLFGNEEVKIIINDDIQLLPDVTLNVCHNNVYNLSVTGNIITGMVPGCPEAGIYPIKLFTGGKEYITNEKIKYFSPTPQITSLVAVGASYTGGFINLGLNWLDQLHSPFAYVAKEAGAYFPQPLVKKGIFNVIYPSALTEGCFPSNLSRIYIFNLMRVIKKIKSEKGFIIANGRIAPDILPYNLGIGAARLPDTLYGAVRSNNPLVGILEHLVYDPYVDIWGAFSDPPEGSPYDVALKINSKYILSVDLFADDILYTNFATLFNVPMAPGITPIERLKKDLTYFFNKAHEKGKTLFIADLPDITLLPALKSLKHYLINIGYSSDKVENIFISMKKMSREYNQAFYQLVKKYDNVYPVPFSKEVEKFSSGVTIAGNYYNLDFLGGLISLDGIHPTWTGYALIANLFIRKINETLGLEIPMVDIGKIAQMDPLKIEKISQLINIKKCRNEFYSGR